MIPVVSFACAFAAAPSTGWAQFCPGEGEPIANGAAPFRAAICDLNLDGRPDIVAANADTDNLTVHLGVAGGFASPLIFPADNEPVDVDCCDVDGDGDLDVVTANRSDSQVNVLENFGMVGGLLHLENPLPYAVGLAPWGVRCLELNTDDRPDLVTSNFTGESISILLNKGDGTFLPHQDVATGGDGTYYLSECDLDADFDDDVVVSNLTGQSITSFRNDGSGTLVRLGSYSVGNLVFPWGIICCDVDGDGHPDAVTANGGDNTISVLHNNGAGQFDVLPPAIFSGPGQPFGIACGDIDRDGDVDILTSNLGSDDVSMMTNTLGEFELTRSLGIGSNVGSVVLSDVDLDRDLDVLATAGTDVLLFFSDCIFGDTNGDELVNLTDHVQMAQCMAGPATSISEECTVLDFDRNNSVDLFDWSAFQLSLNP